MKEAWKGVSGDSAVVHGQGPGASCGPDFERDETYLVFAYRTGEDGPLQADYCGNTFAASQDTARNIPGPPPTGSLPETGGVSLDPAEKNVASVYAGGIFLAAAWLSLLAVVFGYRTVRTRRRGARGPS